MMNKVSGEALVILMYLLSIYGLGIANLLGLL